MCDMVEDRRIAEIVTESLVSHGFEASAVEQVLTHLALGRIVQRLVKQATAFGEAAHAPPEETKP